MQIGMMNNPAHDPVAEINWAAGHGFDYIDLTLEHPKAAADLLDEDAVHAAIMRAGIGVIGHTAWYLPIASPVSRVRRAAIEEVASTFPIFARLGAHLVNVHPDAGRSVMGQDENTRLNAAAFATLAEQATAHGLRLIVENIVGAYESVAAFQHFLAADPRIGWHYDIGHAQVRGNRSHEYLTAFGGRLAHVHLSDNSGRSDDHLPLGVGRLDWKRLVRQVKRNGYDGTITLEVFADDRDYLLASRDRLRAAWNAAA